MKDLRTASVDELFAAFEAGTTLRDVERRYHDAALDEAQHAAALELFLRAERMTGHDFGIASEDLLAVARSRGVDSERWLPSEAAPDGGALPVDTA